MEIKSTSRNRSFEREKSKFIKQNAKKLHTCPVCRKSIEIGFEKGVLTEISDDGNYPFPHIYLHGKPLHVMICYVDTDYVVQGVGSVRSIEISRDSDTFQELMRKWSNPY